MSSFYDLAATTPQGTQVPMSTFKGNVVLVVNTATKCGLAPQFEGLEALYQQYKDKGLVVLGFPCDQFAGQEPETNKTVEAICKLNFGVTFPLMAKSKVNGKETNEVFKYLKNELGGTLGSAIKWNFTKFLIDKDGKPVKRYAPTTKPEAIAQDILTLL